MNDFNEFVKDLRPDDNVEGCFDCQWCAEEVDTAFYNPQKQTLEWVCQYGHKSLLEKFKL